MATQRTRFLMLLVLAGATAALLTYARLDKARDAAERSSIDFASCRQQLADLAEWRDGAIAASPGAAGDPELNLSLRSAATIAGVADELTSIEPGQPTPIRDSDFSETPIFLRLRATTIKQLVTFLHRLSTDSTAMRAKAIELSSPDAAGATETRPGGSSSVEQWTSDVTLAHLNYTPRPRAGGS